MGASPSRSLVGTSVVGGVSDKGGGQSSGERRGKTKVYVAAENRLVRESLARMLAKKRGIEVSGLDASGLVMQELVNEKPEILLLTSRGVLTEDLEVIRRVRAETAFVRILLVGTNNEAVEFLQCVRAGINGYLLRDASSSELLQAVTAVGAGEAVCPGKLCARLFQYFQAEAAALPCASAKRRMGLTRREQQLIPLLSQGLTNKEIANHFSLSEQTIKNHVYRMKHKIGAEDRLDIVQFYRAHGYLVPGSIPS
jgi:two-component system, NarL family, nitrate/nitrite response regulator NarL